MTSYLGKISYSLYLSHPTIVAYLGKFGVYVAIYQTISLKRAALYFTWRDYADRCWRVFPDLQMDRSARHAIGKEIFESKAPNSLAR